VTDPDELLAPTHRPAGAEVRDRVREATTNVVRRTHRWIRFRRIASMAACYAAGAATLWFALPTPESVVVEVVRIERVPIESPPPVPVALSGRELELLAEQADGAASAAKYREAGDRFFLVENDYQSAVRCYRQHLDRAPPTPTGDDDNWLLTSLKNSRQKKNDHANFDG